MSYMMPAKSKILTTISEFYLKSRDFNGCPYKVIQESIKIDKSTLVRHIIDLINDDLVGLISPAEDMNTHIIRTGFKSKESQISNLNNLDEYHTCFYPLKKQLRSIVNPSSYNGKPYKLSLAYGSAQLEYRTFDISILEIYRNDPRYYYETNDIGGSIHITDEYFESDHIKDSDKVLLQSFGYAFNDQYHRFVAAFVRDLAGLSSEHQLIWDAKEIKGKFQIHPGFYNSQVLGSWAPGVSIFQAIIKEIYIINSICLNIGFPLLFRNDFGKYGENSPKHFTYLIRPTLKEYSEFILVFDKILSENLNKEFFKEDLNLEKEILRDDGNIVVQPKATITLLDEWVRKFYHFEDDSGWNSVIKAFRRIRTLRQKPAHIIEEDKFNQEYIVQQKQISIDVYNGLNFLRKLFQRHPDCQVSEIDIPDWLEQGKIYAY